MTLKTKKQKKNQPEPRFLNFETTAKQQHFAMAHDNKMQNMNVRTNNLVFSEKLQNRS